MFEFDYYKSPVGKLKLIASTKGLSGLLWEGELDERVLFGVLKENKQNKFILKAKKQLDEYFSGERKSFSIALDMKGTEFQKKVWNQLGQIPFGRTKSYKEIAVKIKNPKASRGVGSANRRNPVSIIVPCHRVIGSNGKLTGFAGGLNVKSWLLEFEKENFH
jgi:methylated-DNA-[protein]-cysteine S-methyltransferase